MLSIPCIRHVTRFKPQFQYEVQYGERKNISATITMKNFGQIPVIAEPYVQTASLGTSRPSYQKFVASKDYEIQDIIDEITEIIKIHDPIANIQAYVMVSNVPDIKSQDMLTDIYNLGVSYFTMPANLKLLNSHLKVGDVYNRYKNPDGFLYIIYIVQTSIVNGMARNVFQYLNM